MNIKLYFNTSCLEICDSENYASQNQSVTTHFVKKGNSLEMENISKDFLTSGVSKHICVICASPESFISEYKKRFTYIEAAGGVIEKEKEFLFIYRHGIWDLPKGKREKNESIEDCAVRECEEECGVNNLHIVKELDSSYHIYPYRGKLALKRSFWFYMRTEYNKPLVPQLEEDITEVKWFTRKAVLNNVLPYTYTTIQSVVRQALDLSATGV